MKHEKRLNAGERWDVTAVGRYIGYVSGAGEIELLVNGEPHLLDVREGLRLDEPFNGFSIVSLANGAGDFVLKTGSGSLYMAGDGQLTEVTRIAETVDTELVNPSDISNPIVSKIAELIGSVINIRAITEVLNIRTITETLNIRAITEVLNIRPITEVLNIRPITETLDIRPITETLDIRPITEMLDIRPITETLKTTEAPATSLATSQKVFTAGESFTIPANTNRRDITVLTAETNTDVITVGGVPLAAGDRIEFKSYVGAVLCDAVAADQINITEVIK